METHTEHLTTWTIKPTHISEIKQGDTILHQGKMMTVCNSDIKIGSFMGTSVFGDSYRLGNLPVKLLIYNRPV